MQMQGHLMNCPVGCPAGVGIILTHSIIIDIDVPCITVPSHRGLKVLCNWPRRFDCNDTASLSIGLETARHRNGPSADVGTHVQKVSSTWYCCEELAELVRFASPPQAALGQRARNESVLALVIAVNNVAVPHLVLNHAPFNWRDVAHGLDGNRLRGRGVNITQRTSTCGHTIRCICLDNWVVNAVVVHHPLPRTRLNLLHGCSSRKHNWVLRCVVLRDCFPGMSMHLHLQQGAAIRGSSSRAVESRTAAQAECHRRSQQPWAHA
mmetsp:Transcript_123458/g.343927  ORF Transcript_123458/g.343927 Transcript_123458/m.343927 type:complete len:265 (+) Transcript_123458:604-1398(+)